jgi:signal recognition particle subunit SRP54
MFENLSDRLEQIYKKLRGRGKLKETDVDESLREIRVALIEADVSLTVIKDFLATVREKAIGQEVMKSLTPGHQMVKIVSEELIALLGEEVSGIRLASNSATIILMVGLQGSGKTTTAGKLARMFKKEGKKCLLVPADVYRPAAIEQLNTLGRDLGIDVYQAEGEKDPVVICTKALEDAARKACQIIILDTAGRTQIDEPLMEELRRIKEKTKPHEVLFVADAMMGQQAVNIARTFNDSVGIDGVILTKMDGDARGGAALSIKAVIGKPIKYMGMGEKLDALEPFFPDRVVSRILGKGDVMTLVERAQQAYDLENQAEIEEKFKKNTFSLEDFRDQLRQVRKMGPLEQLIGMIPGASKIKNMKVDEGGLNRVEAIINSMTQKERLYHNIINGSRKRRIAMGSGTTVNDVNRLLKQFVQMKKMMKKFSGANTRGMNLSQLMGR